MDDDSTASWIASLRASRANLIPSQENAKEQKTSDGSGPISPESSGNAIQVVSLSKTLRDSLETAQPVAIRTPSGWATTQTMLFGAEWERFSGIWPKWGASLSGEVYELPKWEPATDARGCSFWPTSRAEDSESTGAHRGNLDTLNSAALDWSTPQAHDTHQGQASRNGRMGTKAGCRNLTDEVMEWRSPDAPKSGGVRTHTTSQGAGHQTTIAEQAEQWQTPATDSFRSRGGDRKDEMGLDQQARFWPSPAARDYRDPNLLSYQERTGTTKGEQLNNFVEHHWKMPHGLQLLAGDPGGGGEFADQATNWEPSLPARLIPAGLTFSERVRILLPLCRQLRRRLPSPYKQGALDLSQEIESLVCGLADGVARWLVERRPRLQCGGNGVVPLQAAAVFRILARRLGIA